MGAAVVSLKITLLVVHSALFTWMFTNNNAVLEQQFTDQSVISKPEKGYKKKDDIH
jgi:hypothetical protein